VGTAIVRSLPKNYKLLLEIVSSEHGRHLTAHEVYVEARIRQPAIGFATVHRGLIRLCELGEVMKIETPGREAAWYEAAAKAHAHLQCVECGAIVDVEYATPERTRAAIASRTGLEISGEVLMFRGRCRGCAGLSQAQAGQPQIAAG
jgi:Fur family ferric uptake transcriptional regulator